MSDHVRREHRARARAVLDRTPGHRDPRCDPAGAGTPTRRPPRGRAYGASAKELVHRLRGIPSAVPSVLVIGHNPGIESAALELAGRGDQALLGRLRDKMPTGALATLELDGEWTDAATGTAGLVSFVVPRELA